jgi:outer membrane protein
MSRVPRLRAFAAPILFAALLAAGTAPVATVAPAAVASLDDAVVRPAPGAAAPDTAAARLTISAAVERALTGHPSVGAARAAVDEARGAKGVAAASLYPSLRVSATGTRYEEPAIVSPIHAFTPDLLPPFSRSVLQGSASLTYTLFDGGGREGRIGRARALVRASEASLDATAQSLASRVIRSYLDALARRQVLDAHESRIEALRSERDRVRQRYGVGRAADVDRMRIEAALATADADRVRAAVALDAAERDLARYLGTTQAETSAGHLVAVALADTLLAPRDTLIAQAMRGSAAMAQARQQSDAARSGLRAARGAYWPELKLGGMYGYYAAPDGYNTFEWSAMLQVSQPLFTGGEIKSSVRRADAVQRGAQEQLRAAALDVDRELDRSLATIRQSRARVAGLTSAVANYEEVTRIQRLLLETGAGTQTDYLNAEADLLAARGSLVEARYDEVAARAELARVTGVLDLAWIEQNLEPEP